MPLRLIFMFAFCIGVVVMIAAAVQSRSSTPESRVPLKSGDVVFQSSGASEALLLERLSDSPYSHVGIVDVTPQGPYVIEAAKPKVTRTPWTVWWKTGLGHHVTIMRASNLSDADAHAVIAAASGFVGHPFDEVLDWDDDHLYSSELVVKAFDHGAHLTLGQTQRLDSLHLAGLDADLEERFGGKPPGDRLIVTPASVAADSNLTMVWSSFPKAGGKQAE